ncbi:hypothetical protein ABXN37_09740 [Piscinibacter sakaiensis]|uniref:hypothetical protein n=1 Tax=Piscinibacter sakaiensis TaxID=1547922 RepID=UPI00372B9916
MQIQPHPNAGKVVALQGRAVARSPDGRLRVLQLGDWVAHDEVIITSQNGFVQLATGPDAAAAVPAAAAADAPLEAPRCVSMRWPTRSASAASASA